MRQPRFLALACPGLTTTSRFLAFANGCAKRIHPAFVQQIREPRTLVREESRVFAFPFGFQMSSSV